MFGLLKNLTKAVVGVVVSPIDIAADILTCGGAINDRGEPYTVSRMRDVMRNLDCATDPDNLTDDQIRAVIDNLRRRR